MERDCENAHRSLTSNLFKAALVVVWCKRGKVRRTGPDLVRENGIDWKADKNDSEGRYFAAREMVEVVDRTYKPMQDE
jgi:hypothetical protein